MLVHLKPKVVALLIAGLSASPLMAAVSNPQLEAKVSLLEQEIASIKKQVKTNQTNIQSNKQHISAVKKAGPLSQEAGLYMPFDPDLPGKSLVAIGPYTGIELTFSGSNLIVNSPSVNTDVQLLGIRKKILKQMHENQENLFGDHPTVSDHPHLLFSGVIETQAWYMKPGGGKSTSDIDVTNVSLDATIFGPTDWLLGFIELSYDNATPMGSPYTSTSNFRTSNSRVYVNKAFVTVGNLTTSPLYATFGQFYVPFGRYSTFMVSDTLTKLLTRTKARSILVGYQQEGDNSAYAAAYVFRGDSHRGSVGSINNGGLNLGYRFKAGLISGDIGGGVIGNIADSGGMQAGTGFQNFERIDHRVPGYNARALISIGEHIDLLGEYVTASTEFNPMDMSYNNHGAKPYAFDVEGSYSFSLCDKPSSIGIGYGKSNEALAMGIPLTRTSIAFNTSLMRNTLQSLEFRRDREYAAHDVASGAGGVVAPAQSGKIDNAVTAQFDFYF